MNATATAINKAQKHSESIKNDALKRHETFEPGDVSAQGDINIVCIKTMPTSAKTRKDRQLADGNTQGSRHVLDKGDVFDADKAALASLIKDANGCEVPEIYIGPVFRGAGEPSFLSHPEHGDQEFPAGSICAVTYQRNLERDEREARVQD